MEGEKEAQRIPSLEEIAEWVHLTPPPIVAPTVERSTDVADAAVLPVEAVGAGRGAAPSTMEPQAEERTLNVTMPSLEEIVGWADLPPLPFPRSAAEALDNRLDAPEAALGGAGVGSIGHDLPPYTVRHLEVAGVVDVALDIPASPNAGQGCIGGGGGGGGSGSDGGRDDDTGSSWDCLLYTSDAADE